MAALPDPRPGFARLLSLTTTDAFAIDALRAPGRGAEAFDVHLLAGAASVSADITTRWDAEDLRRLAEALEAIAGASAGSSVVATVHGGAAARLDLEAEVADAGRGELSVAVHLTPSGQDPFPRASFLLVCPAVRFARGATAVRRLIEH